MLCHRRAITILKYIIMNQKEEMYNDKENGGGGGNYHSFEATKTDKAIVWVTIALIAFAIGLTIFLCVK